MCDYCKKHATEFLAGHRWYLNPECYSEDIAMTKDRVKIYNQILGHPIEYYFEFTNRALRLQNWPVPFLKRAIRWYTRALEMGKDSNTAVGLRTASEAAFQIAFCLTDTGTPEEIGNMYKESLELRHRSRELGESDSD